MEPAMSCADKASATHPIYLKIVKLFWAIVIGVAFELLFVAEVMDYAFVTVTRNEGPHTPIGVCVKTRKVGLVHWFA
jgi:hypothetical protein